MITIWRRYECTQIDDTAPRFVWVPIPRIAFSGTRAGRAVRFEERQVTYPSIPGRGWSIHITTAGAQFTRFHPDGRVSEIYRSVSLPEAAVWLAAISQGFEPPPVLRAFDTPAG